MDKKYKLIKSDIKGLYRVKALRNFGDVKKGDIGGYVENPNNLSHEGYCWVYDNAIIHDNVKIYDNARIYGNSEISDYAVIQDNARIYGDSQIWDYAVIDGNSRIYGDSQIWDYAIIRDNALIYGDSAISGNAFIDGDAEIKTGRHIGYIEEKFKNVLYIQCKASLITVYTDMNNIIKCNIGFQKRMTLTDLINRIKEDGGMNEHREEYVRIMKNAHLLLGQEGEL